MSARLDLALDLLKATDWRRFEKFASTFLVSEFPGLMEMAAPSGDGGRDAEVFSIANDPTVYMQYSVTPDWEAKIRATAKRLNETFPGAQILVYATPKSIGANGDAIKRELRKEFKLHLEIRDKSYFVNRCSQSSFTETASEGLAQDIVDPYLASRSIGASKTSALTSSETRAAHVFLMLQLKDDTAEKGLTKLSFEAIIRSVLVNTDSDHRMKKHELMRQVVGVLAGHPITRVSELANTALARLVKRRIVRWHKQDETVCLAFEESIRVMEHLASCEVDEKVLDAAILSATTAALKEESIQDADLAQVSKRARRVLENCLFVRAENFAHTVLNGRICDFELDHLQEAILKDLTAFPPFKGSWEGDPVVLHEVISSVLGNTDAPDYQYLKGLADAYTLMAFLNMTPDVQEVMQKIFSHGEIWIDTTIILPMIAEELLEEGQGRIQQILAMTRRAGIDLYTTSGVLEELASHLRRAVAYTYVPSSQWEGSIPFIFEAYIRAGKDPNCFSSWVETLMGDARPAEDLGAYIEERFGIKTQDLAAEVSAADPVLRSALDTIWQEWHEQRRTGFKGRRNQRELDPLTVLRLAKHDTESYLGVLQRRTSEPNSPLGYKCWWLTFDRYAARVSDALQRHGLQAPSSPVLSIDFLSQYLSLGPVRGKVTKEEILRLPMAIQPRLIRFLTPEILEEAKRIRVSLTGLPERVIMRKVRDHLDSERRKRGPLSERGTDTVFDEIDDLELRS